MAAGVAAEAVENNAVWAAIPAIIYVLDKAYTAYQVYQDIQDLKSGKKTVEQLAREKGESYITQAIVGNIGKYGYKIVKSSSRRIVQAVKKTCSFHGSTLISTANGYKPISAIRIGDFVWSRDEYTGKYSYQPVTNWYHNQYQETVYVTIVDSQGNEQILISNAIHPFFAKVPYDTITPVSSEGHDYQGEIDHGVWVDASNLQAGYQLLSEDGTWQTIKSVSITKEALTAYNLTVDNTHTYFASAQGGKYGVWVHNADCCGRGLTGNNWTFNPNKDVDLRGTGKSYRDALDEAFKRTGVPKEQFVITKWAKDKYGKSIPVEYSAPNGANVNIDIPKFNNVTNGVLGNGPHQPHIGYQNTGKGSNRIRGHIFVDEIPATRR
ncbi:hypothetical protein C0133_08570 [Moraxella catarrhalis]|nr:hypothetical protein [Moraxella catarrhalis]